MGKKELEKQIFNCLIHGETNGQTCSAFSQKPRKKSTQISVLSLTFLCKYGQSDLKHIPCK